MSNLLTIHTIHHDRDVKRCCDDLLEACFVRAAATRQQPQPPRHQALALAERLLTDPHQSACDVTSQLGGVQAAGGASAAASAVEGCWQRCLLRGTRPSGGDTCSEPAKACSRQVTAAEACRASGSDAATPWAAIVRPLGGGHRVSRWRDRRRTLHPPSEHFRHQSPYPVDANT